jgi:hypothetical protein
MQRREFNHVPLAGLLGWALIAPMGHAHAQGLAALSGADATAGIKAALASGAKAAVQQLGQNGGFMDNPKVRIGLPGMLAEAEPLLKVTGQGKRLDELLAAMNHAAEQAVPLAAELLQRAIQSLTVGDAKRILTGGDTSVTEFFATKTRAPLGAQFLPVVHKATDGVQLAEKYQAVAGRAAQLGLLKKEDADLPGYVTGRTLDGLYLVIGEEERKIRQNPAQAGSAMLQKVFGAL